MLDLVDDGTMFIYGSNGPESLAWWRKWDFKRHRRVQQTQYTGRNIDTLTMATSAVLSSLTRHTYNEVAKLRPASSRDAEEAEAELPCPLHQTSV